MDYQKSCRTYRHKKFKNLKTEKDYSFLHIFIRQ